MRLKPELLPDTNECLVNNGGCDQICENTVGSFLCHCRENYKLEPDGRTCRRK